MRRNDHRSGRTEQERVAVRRRLGDEIGAERAVRAGPVLNSTGWPSDSLSFGAIARATKSAPPPAAKVTIMRTGLAG